MGVDVGVDGYCLGLRLGLRLGLGFRLGFLGVGSSNFFYGFSAFVFGLVWKVFGVGLGFEVESIRIGRRAL